jgi:hypothetical protein
MHSIPLVPKLCSADPKETRDLFVEDPWIHFCNGYFEVYNLKARGFVKYSRGTSLIDGMFISYGR